MEKECKDEEEKVVVPPINSVLRVPVNHIEVQIDGHHPARRKALPKEAARRPSSEKQPRKEGVEGHQGHQPVILPRTRGISWAPDTIERSARARFHAQHEKMRAESSWWVMASSATAHATTHATAAHATAAHATAAHAAATHTATAHVAAAHATAAHAAAHAATHAAAQHQQEWW
jgi:hypothetical protein